MIKAIFPKAWIVEACPPMTVTGVVVEWSKGRKQMTTRIKGFAVTLAEDLRTDDAEEIRRALSMVRGVVSVDVVETGLHDVINRERIRDEFTTAIIGVAGREGQMTIANLKKLAQAFNVPHAESTTTGFECLHCVCEAARKEISALEKAAQAWESQSVADVLRGDAARPLWALLTTIVKEAHVDSDKDAPRAAEWLCARCGESIGTRSPLWGTTCPKCGALLSETAAKTPTERTNRDAVRADEYGAEAFLATREALKARRKKR